MVPQFRWVLLFIFTFASVQHARLNYIWRMSHSGKKNTKLTTVYVTNLANAVSEDTIRKFFSFCGNIRGLKVLGYALACRGSITKPLNLVRVSCLM